jgi:hypothetical protein
VIAVLWHSIRIRARQNAEVSMQNTMDIMKKIAELESINDHLLTEILYINELLKNSGFPQGLDSLKQVAQEMLDSNPEDVLE